MKVLVGTVFKEDNDLQRKWLDLQLSFLAATTEAFEHVSVVWGGTKGDHFAKKTTVIEPEGYQQASQAHVKGLRYLLHFFRQREAEFDNFLFLDSDAFPIRVDWMKHLLRKMTVSPVFGPDGAFLREEGRDFEIAIPVRSENLENRLHASILFVKKVALPHISFDYQELKPDLCGNCERDVHLPDYEEDRRRLALPLMRSNQWNVHPLACGIYFDLFYHHCCGSGREFNLRANKYWDAPTDMSKLTWELMKPE